MTLACRASFAIVAALLGAAAASGWTPPEPPPALASPQEMSATGTLFVRAVQGTPDGPAIGATKVEVHLYGKGGLVGTLERTLDETGEITIEEIPLGTGVQPVVVVHHAGVTYQKGGAVLDPAHPHEEIEVTCFELMEATPDWTVTMRHVMVEPVEGGLAVVEMLSLSNPAERTWLGVPDTSVAPGDKRVTTRFMLPHGATNVELGRGFHDWCCTTRTDHGLVNHLPLMPTGAEMTYRYVIPASAQGRAMIDVVAPAPTQHLMVIVPQALNIAGTEGLQHGGEQTMNDKAVTYLVATNQGSNAVARVAIDGLSSGATLANTGEPGGSSAVVKIVAGVGGGLIVLAAFVVVLSRPAGTRKEA